MAAFGNDYCEGAIPEILKRLERSQGEVYTGYGEDAHCKKAAEEIKALCLAPQAAVHFLMGGTQTNAAFFAAALRPHEGVITADTGHIAIHESGAVEASGHKVLPLGQKEGKISAQGIARMVQAHRQDETREHMVSPRAVYLSYPTELGTLYSREEMEAIAKVCKENELLLYVDGARLAYGLGAAPKEITPADLARWCDGFYIGGTKCGALFGEALVLLNPEIQKEFRYIQKQRGAMLAKGWLLGMQFETLLEGNRYETLGKHAVEMARRVKEIFRAKGYALWIDSPTNQQFPLLPLKAVGKLREAGIHFSYWGPGEKEGEDIYRFCTSWATTPEEVEELEKILGEREA